MPFQVRDPDNPDQWVEMWPWGYRICYEPLRVEYYHPDEPFEPPESMLRP